MDSVTFGSLLRNNRNFRLFWGGQIVSQLGDWFSVITIQALLVKHTGSASAVAGFMIAHLLPHFLLGPVAGVLVDRLPRKTVMVGADIARAVVALGLLFFRGPETVWVAFACLALISSFTAFFEPARIATLPNITSDEELVTANALSSVTWSVLLTSGALAGGVVAHLFGSDVAFGLNSLSFLGSAILLAQVRVPANPRTAGGAGQETLQAGIAYVLRRRDILGSLTAKFGWGLAGGVQGLLAIYGQRVFPISGDRDGQLAISVLYACSGVGTALGPLVARHYAGRDVGRIRWWIAVSFLLAGVYYAVMAAAPNLVVFGGVLLLARIHGAIVWVFSTVLLQMLTEDRFRGRVFAAETSLFTVTMMLSNVVTSQAVDARWATPAQAVLAAGVLSVMVGVIWSLALLRRPATATVPPSVDQATDSGMGSGSR